MYVYDALSRTGPLLFCNIQCSRLFCLSVIYKEVKPAGSVHFPPDWPASKNCHATLSFPSPILNEPRIRSRCMNDLGNSLPY